MDKREINSPRLTANFLIWIGGVFLLLLFAFIAHFVWKILRSPSLSQIKVAPFGATIQRGKEFWKVMSGKAMHGAVLASQNGGSGNVENDGRE